MKEKVKKIFNDLDRFRFFCVEYGYSFNEADLYNNKKRAWIQYSRYVNGKTPLDNWNRDKRESV